MSDVPDSPEEFFTKFIPARFGAVKGALAGRSSAGSMVFRVAGGGEWSFSLKDGELEVTPGVTGDVILQVTVPEEDFKAIFVRGAEAAGDDIKPEAQVMAFKAITIDAAKANMVKAVAGTVAFMVKDGDAVRKLAITPGSATPNLDAPDCKLECQMSDFLEMQGGKAQPVQLAMSGKIRIVGNAQIPMALSGVLA